LRRFEPLLDENGQEISVDDDIKPTKGRLSKMQQEEEEAKNEKIPLDAVNADTATYVLPGQLVERFADEVNDAIGLQVREESFRSAPSASSR
jgi:hypothetical protein